MDKKGRKVLSSLIDQLRVIAEEEREKADNLAEYFSDAERTENQEELANALEEAVDTLEGIE